MYKMNTKLFANILVFGFEKSEREELHLGLKPISFESEKENLIVD